MPGQYYELEKKQRKKVIWKYQDLVKRIFGTTKAQHDANTYINNSNFGVQMMLTRIFNEWNRDTFNQKPAKTTIKNEAIPVIKLWIKSAKDFEIREVLLFLKYLSRDDLMIHSDTEFFPAKNETSLTENEDQRSSTLNRRKSDMTISEVIERSAELRSGTSSRFTRSQSEKSIISTTSTKLSRNQQNNSSRIRSRSKKKLIDVAVTPNSRMSGRMSTGLSRISNASSLSNETPSGVPDLRNNTVKFLSPIETPTTRNSNISKFSESSALGFEDENDLLSISQISNRKLGEISKRQNELYENEDTLKPEPDSRQSTAEEDGDEKPSSKNNTETHSVLTPIEKTVDNQENPIKTRSVWDDNPERVSSAESEIVMSSPENNENNGKQNPDNYLPAVNVGCLFRRVVPKKTGTPYPK